MATERQDEDRAPEIVPDPRIDTTVPQNARVWNYWLGGKDNYAVDRQMGDQIAAIIPGIVDIARADREFLNRVVSHLAGEAGIRQFLDIGTGLPTANNTHEVAQRIAPASRVVYTDNDPTVLIHARALLVGTSEGSTDYIDADVHDPATILARAADTLDLSEPVAVLMFGVLNFVADTDEALAIVRRLMDAVPSGSYLVIAHPTSDMGGETNAQAMRLWNENSPQRIRTRTGDEVRRLLDGLEVLEPGLVSVSQWRAEPDESGDLPAEVPAYGVLARKP
ncbi:MAG TPA: SAM-dependent methyltransferase [Jiangellaceae bacterium]